MKTLDIILFDRFETLDAFGPAEIFGRMCGDYRVEFSSFSGGNVASAQNALVATSSFDRISPGGILLIPGGIGTRDKVNDAGFIEALTRLTSRAQYVLCVCTGSALLAKTGLLDKVHATTNKRAFDWVMQQGAGVLWVRRARWVADGKFYTSSGVSAGMDMALGFLRDMHGMDVARQVAHDIEYVWREDSTDDPFC